MHQRTIDEGARNSTVSNGVSFAVGLPLAKSDGATVKNRFWASMSKAVDEIPRDVVVMMAANAGLVDERMRVSPTV